MPPPLSAQPSPPGQQPPKKRRRPALACVQCRRRKIRCDQNTPCQNCVKAGISPCEIPPNHISTLRSGGASVGSSSSPQDGGSVRREGGSYGEYQRRDSEYQSAQRRDSNYHSASRHDSDHHSHPSPNPDQHSHLPHSDHQNPTPRPLGPSGTLTPGPTPRSDTSGTAVSGAQVEVLLSKIEGLERTVGQLQADIKADEDERRQAATTRREASPGPRFGNQSSWLNDTVLYRTVLRTLKEAVTETPNSPLALHIKTCQALLQTIETHLTMPSFISAPLGSRMPDLPTRRTLLNNYYATYESIFRVLDVPIFEEEHGAYTQLPDPTQAREIFVLQLQMCLALGSKSLHRQSERNNTAGIGDTLSYRNVANHWLCQAQSWLATKGKNHAITFEALQLYTLMTLYEAEEQGAEKPAWVLTGDLLRRAMCLNLHQDPKRLGKTNYRKAELHRRLWATILELNLLMSVQTGQSPGISPSDYNTEPPLNLSDLQLGPTIIDPLHQDYILDTKFPLALFSSFPLRLQIATRCSQGSPLTYQELLAFHRDLDLAWGSLAAASQGWYSLLTRHAHHLSRNILASQILALHLPMIGRYGIDDPMHLTSRIVAKAMSLSILEQVAPPQQGTEDQTIRNLFTSSGCLWRNVAMQAVFYLALEQCSISDEIRTHGRPSLTSGDVPTITSTMALARDWVYDRIGMGMKDTHCICFLAAAHRMATDTTQPRDERSLIISGAGDLAASCERKLTRLADETVKFAVREPTEQGGPVAGAHEMAITGVMNPVVDMNWITEPFMGPYDEMLFGWTFDASMGGMMM